MAELTVPQIDFSSLGQLPEMYRQGQANALRQRTLANLGQGGEVDASALLRSGDMSLANLGIQMQNRQQDQARQERQDALQRERYGVEDKFKEQSLALQRAAAARASEDKFAVKEISNPDGTTQLVRVKLTGAEGPIGGGAQPSSPLNPFAGSGKMNGDQSKSATMTDRMAQSHDVITKNENINDGFLGNLGGRAAANATIRDSAEFNMLASPERQQVVQAQRNFINAILRQESGAAIAQSEFDNAARQYFPQPGDSKAVIEQKRQNRMTAMQGMARQAGPAYAPPSGMMPQKSQPVVQEQPSGPAIGTVQGGYRYKGGNPADPNSWVKQ